MQETNDRIYSDEDLAVFKLMAKRRAEEEVENLKLLENEKEIALKIIYREILKDNY